jgi:hypothetical protein
MSSPNGNNYPIRTINNEQNINEHGGDVNSRFTSLQTPKTICKFFIKGLCTKGDKCKFSHNIRDTMIKSDNISNIDNISTEVSDAIDRGNLNTIFEKMLANEENYKKYYLKLYMRFRGVAVLKLKKQSIVRNIIDTIKLRNVTINGETLKYGYMPILFHFIMTGFAWNTFQGAETNADYLELINCFDDVIEQLQKVKVKDHQISKYNDEEYDEMVIEACQYANPLTYDNALHIAAHYLCDNVIQHIKDTFKSNTIRKLKKNSDEGVINNMRTSMSETEYNNFINKDFNDILNETNINNQKPFDLFVERQNNKQEAIDKFKSKYEKVIARAGNHSLSNDAKQRFEYNVNNYDKKIEVFNNQIFAKNLERKKIIEPNINYDAKFNEWLSKLHGFKNKYGTRIEIIELSNLLNLINNNLKHKKDECMKLIINSLPNLIMNPKDVIQKFKDLNNIDSLWNAVLNSIMEDTPATFSVDLVNAFFKEEHVGLRESYICQYLEKLSSISETLSPEKKEIFIQSIISSMVSKDVKSLINF